MFLFNSGIFSKNMYCIESMQYIIQSKFNLHLSSLVCITHQMLGNQKWTLSKYTFKSNKMNYDVHVFLYLKIIFPQSLDVLVISKSLRKKTTLFWAFPSIYENNTIQTYKMTNNSSIHKYKIRKVCISSQW